MSGIQPTGKLHIGNYLGALKNFVELQNSGKYRCFFFIADLHSLTQEYDPKEKPEQIENIILDFFAAGIDPKRSVIFVQSAIPAHSELAWILNTITPMGELLRMTQFKDKSESAPQNINAGLFDYPVLMAADILLYGARFVPVGEDQMQHLELTRTLTRRFNGKFGKVFTEPFPVMTEVPRLMSLDDPVKKMSKSRPEGCLFLDDGPETIRKKIMRAVTDSETEVRMDMERKPAISNLMRIYSAMTGMNFMEIEEHFRGKGYGEFKRELAEVTVKGLAPFQKKKKELRKNRSALARLIAAGNKKANAAAEKKLLEVKKKIGLG